MSGSIITNVTYSKKLSPNVGNGTLKVNSWRRGMGEDIIRPSLDDNSEALREKEKNEKKSAGV